MKTFAFVVAAAMIAGARAACPGSCSGHGRCGAHDACSCYANWQGMDCSQRTCPSDFAWVRTEATTEVTFTGGKGTDAAGADFVWGPHYYAECSNKGSCDRKSGECKCNAGYEGKACARSTCPNDCSGHGTCETIFEVSGEKYKNWDAKKIQGCKCDPYYEGHDCSSRKCPRGDDPLTTASGTIYTTVTLTKGGDNADGQFTLTYADAYGGKWTTFALAHDANAQQVLEALEALPNQVVKDLTVDTDGGNVVVKFTGRTNAGAQGTLTVNTAGCPDAGCQPYYTAIGGTATLTASTDSASVDTNAENAVCSNRGDCDGSTGLCTCHAGYTDEACSTQTALL